jgi:predicted glycosyltransferase
MKRAYETPTVKVVLLPRNKLQENQIRTKWPQWFSGDKALIPSKTVDGLNLLWHSDLVVSGGGTMNREAAALGIPVYSIFRGKIGAVDRDLQKQGRLTLIERVEDVQDKITIQRREKNVNVGSTSSKALQEIVNHVEEIIKADCSR